MVWLLHKPQGKHDTLQLPAASSCQPDLMLMAGAYGSYTVLWPASSLLHCSADTEAAALLRAIYERKGCYDFSLLQR